MKRFRAVVLIYGVLLAAGMVGNDNFLKNSRGCGDSGCHLGRDGDFRLEKTDHLQVILSRSGSLQGVPVSAEILDPRGRVVDYLPATRQNLLKLFAPRPGYYIIRFGYVTSRPYSEVLPIKVNPGKINLPTSRFGENSLKFFPVHPATVRTEVLFRFLLPRQNRVTLTLFNMAGKPVARIYHGMLAAGYHTLRWRPRTDSRRPLSTGTYLCELTVKDKKLVRSFRVRR